MANLKLLLSGVRDAHDSLEHLLGVSAVVVTISPFYHSFILFIYLVFFTRHVFTLSDWIPACVFLLH